MIPSFYTFQEIIRYNSNDWDQAYEVLNYNLQKGTLTKEIRGHEDIVYHNLGKIELFDFVHKQIFFFEEKRFY